MRTKTFLSACAGVVLVSTVAQAAPYNFNTVYTSAPVSVAVGPATIGSSPGASGMWGKLAPPAGPQTGGVKISSPSSFSRRNMDDGVTYTLSFDARFSGYTGFFQMDMSVKNPSFQGPFFSLGWFNNGDPLGNDGLWHHYSTTLTTTDGSAAIDRFGIHDWQIFDGINNDTSPVDGQRDAFTFEIDNLSILNGVDQQWLPQIGATVNDNAFMDNGDPYNPLTYGQPVNGHTPNGGANALFLVVPEPMAGGMLMGLAALLGIRRRRAGARSPS